MAGNVQCELCPKSCEIAPGQSGDCRARINLEGKLIAATYGRPCALHIDPIEKKPLFHFLPASRAFSIAAAGCNLHCNNCQNWEISQAMPYEVDSYDLPPAEGVKVAQAQGCASIAYTYTDPSIFYEYVLDMGALAKEAGVRNLAITAGYLSPAPARKWYREVIDAANIDLKYFDDALYVSNSSGHLKPVLDSIVIAKEEGVWVELTNLVIPTLNDSTAMLKAMCEWIVRETGPDTPLHFSRFFPQYRLKNLPPTPPETLYRAREIAQTSGLRYVYIGNLRGRDYEITRCPNDGTELIKRAGYKVLSNIVTPEGQCPTCQTPIAGVFA